MKPIDQNLKLTRPRKSSLPLEVGCEESWKLHPPASYIYSTNDTGGGDGAHVPLLNS